MTTTAAEGKLAQEKLFEVVRRSERSRRGGAAAPPVVLSERELNAFLSRHLGQVGELPLSDIGVRLPGAGRVEVVGRLPLRHLLSEPPLAAVGAAFPTGWLDRKVWIDLEADAKVETGASGRRRYLRLDVREFRIGRQALPSVLSRLVLDPTTLGLLRWPLPEAVSEVTIESGRAVIRTAS